MAKNTAWKDQSKKFDNQISLYTDALRGPKDIFRVSLLRKFGNTWT